MTQFRKTLIKTKQLFGGSKRQISVREKIDYSGPEARAEGLFSFHGLDKNNVELVLNFV